MELSQRQITRPTLNEKKRIANIIVGSVRITNPGFVQSFYTCSQGSSIPGCGVDAPDDTASFQRWRTHKKKL